MDTFYSFVWFIVTVGMEHTVSLSYTCAGRGHSSEYTGDFLPGLHRTFHHIYGY